MHRAWKHILIITPIALFICLMGFLLFYPVPKPPVGEIEYARETISQAAKDNAHTYSELLFNEARRSYDSAMYLWKLENLKHRYSRNFAKVSVYAARAAKKAFEASHDSKTNTVSLNARLMEKINMLKETDKLLKERFSKYPLTSERWNNISRGEMLLAEGNIDWERGKYLEAEKKINEAEKLLVPAFDFANEDLKKYFRSFPQWRKWADSTITASRDSQEYSIIVDKYARKLFVYLNGEIKFTYTAELGKNWVGDKKIRGDKATPEGMYKVAKMFRSDSTKYYKALLLDYPNEEDTVVFNAMIEKGVLPRSAKIGGMIEIHGNGGKGSDWTAGCIALTDREMDSLFRIAKVGMPVTIVGSMYDLKRVLKR